MKNIIKIVTCFVLFFIMSKGLAMAVVSPIGVDSVIDQNIEKVPIVVTPTNTLIKQINNVIDIGDAIKPLATKTPTPIIVTQVVTATPEPTASVTVTNKPTVTGTTTITLNPVETVTAEPTIEEVEMTEEDSEETDSNNWFWGVTIGLLILVLVAQIWSTKIKK